MRTWSGPRWKGSGCPLFTRFRRLISLIILTAMGVSTYLGLQRAGAVAGAFWIILQQALFLFGGIGLVLLLAYKYRARPEE